MDSKAMQSLNKENFGTTDENNRKVKKSKSFQDVFKEYYKFVLKAKSKNDTINNKDEINNSANKSGTGFQNAYEHWLSSYDPEILEIPIFSD